jgi:hypothetical protein
MAILITAASHAEAYKLERLLQFPDVVFADYQEMPQLAYSGKKFTKIPKGNSTSYAHEILKTALNLGVEKIFPLYADEILPLAEAKQLFEEYGILVIVPSLMWVKRQKQAANTGNSGWVVLEMGKVIAGEFPSKIALPDEKLNGIFTFKTGELDPVLNILTV